MCSGCDTPGWSRERRHGGIGLLGWLAKQTLYEGVLGTWIKVTLFGSLYVNDLLVKRGRLFGTLNIPDLYFSKKIQY